MANEGSTKPTYSELEAENLRVRGLLQRALNKIANAGHDLLALEGECPKAALIALELTEALVSEGAESADIGTDKSGKVNRVDEKTAPNSPAVQKAMSRFTAALGARRKKEAMQIDELRQALTHIPEPYKGRLSYDYNEKTSMFDITTNGYGVAQSEDSEVAHAICQVFNVLEGSAETGGEKADV